MFNLLVLVVLNKHVELCLCVCEKESVTCEGLFLLPPRCGSLPPRPACLALWPPGLSRNRTVAPVQYTVFCEYTHTHSFQTTALSADLKYTPKRAKCHTNIKYSHRQHEQSVSQSKILSADKSYRGQKQF